MKLDLKYYQKLYGSRAFFRRRGFGVHSPFAYRLLTEVVALPEACYYVESLFQDAPLPALFYRLGVNYPLREIKISGAVSEPFHIVADLLSREKEVSPTVHPCGPFRDEERYLLNLLGEGTEFPPIEKIPDYYIALILHSKGSLQNSPKHSLIAERGISVSLRQASLLIINPYLESSSY